MWSLRNINLEKLSRSCQHICVVNRIFLGICLNIANDLCRNFSWLLFGRVQTSRGSIHLQGGGWLPLQGPVWFKFMSFDASWCLFCRHREEVFTCKAEVGCPFRAPYESVVRRHAVRHLQGRLKGIQEFTCCIVCCEYFVYYILLFWRA